MRWYYYSGKLISGVMKTIDGHKMNYWSLIITFSLVRPTFIIQLIQNGILLYCEL